MLRGEVDEIRRRYGARQVSVGFSGDPPEEAILDGLIERSHVNGREVTYGMREGVRGRDVALKLLESGCDVTRFEEAQASMHDIFVQVVTGRDDHAN